MPHRVKALGASLGATLVGVGAVVLLALCAGVGLGLGVMWAVYVRVDRWAEGKA